MLVKYTLQILVLEQILIILGQYFMMLITSIP